MKTTTENHALSALGLNLETTAAKVNREEDLPRLQYEIQLCHNGNLVCKTNFFLGIGHAPEISKLEMPSLNSSGLDCNYWQKASTERAAEDEAAAVWLRLPNKERRAQSTATGSALERREINKQNHAAAKRADLKLKELIGKLYKHPEELKSGELADTKANRERQAKQYDKRVVSYRAHAAKMQAQIDAHPAKLAAYHAEVEKLTLKTKAKPELADVVNCLLLDASAGDHETFESWAGEYGYDEDSRAAEEIYKACLKIAKDLEAIPEDVREKAAEILQDY